MNANCYFGKPCFENKYRKMPEKFIPRASDNTTRNGDDNLLIILKLQAEMRKIQSYFMAFSCKNENVFYLLDITM